MKRIRRSLAAVAAITCLAVIPLTPAPAGAVEGAVWSGTCPIMSFGITQPGRALNSSGTFSMTASGNCIGTTPQNVVTSGGGSFALTATTATFGCFSGVAIGQGSVGVPGLPPLNVSITVVNHGGTVTVTLLAPLRFEAVAEFAATSLVGCGTNGVLSGLGSMTYFDPTLPPPLS